MSVVDPVTRALDLAAYGTSPEVGSPEVGALIMAEAQVHATLAVAEQLRLANLIAVSNESSPRRKSEIRVHVGKALRLDEVERFDD